jgi:hypothetical protein
LNLLTDRRSRAHWGLNLLTDRWLLTHWRLNLLTDRWLLAHWGLNLLTNRRLLAHRRLNLLTDRRNILRSASQDGLGMKVLAGQLFWTSLGLDRALGKGRSRTGAHGRRDRMNLLRVDRLNLDASGRRVLADGLGTQSLYLRRRCRGPGMLLKHLLLRGKRNLTRRWSQFGNYGTIGNCRRRRNRRTATAVRKHALPLRRYSGRGSDHLGLAYLVGVDANRGALDRLRRGERILRHRHDSIAIHIVDVGDVDVGHIYVCDPRIGDIHPADVIL